MGLALLDPQPGDFGCTALPADAACRRASSRLAERLSRSWQRKAFGEKLDRLADAAS